MVTKKTRLISVLAAAMMLISLFAGIVMPASAESGISAQATVDLQPVQDVLDVYGALDPDLFVNTEEVDSVIVYAETLLANADDYADEEVLAMIEALEEMAAELELELRNVYPYYPRASEYDLYSQFGITDGYMIDDIADLNYVAANAGNFGAAVTLYFTNDVVIGEGDKANTLNVQASIDGQGHTVSGATVTGGGWLSGSYSGNFIKNITFDSFKHNSLSGTQGMIIGQLFTQNLLIENVTFKNCAITGSGAEYGMLIGRVGVSGSSVAVVTMKNVAVVDCVLTANGNSHDGVAFLIGRFANSSNNFTHQVVVNGLYMSGNRMNGTVRSGSNAGTLDTHQGLGLAFGRSNVVPGDSFGIDINNAIAMNNYAEISGLARVSVFVGADGLTNAKVRIRNSIAINNTGMSGLVFLRGQNAGKTVTENVYTDATYLSYGLNGGNVYVNNNNGAAQKAAVEAGEAAYAINNTSTTTNKMALVQDSDGVLKTVLASDEALATSKVTFKKADGSEIKSFYTDAAGKLIGITDADVDQAIWDYTGDPLADVFTADTIITATGAAMTCEHTYAAGGWTHYVENEIAYHSQKCGNCEYVAVRKCVGELASDDGNTHSTLCATCGAKSYKTAHTYSESAVAQDCENSASVTYTCECGYHFTIFDTTKPALGHLWGESTHNSGTEGANATHHMVCQRGECGFEKDASCDFETSQHNATCETDAYTAYTCKVCNYSYRDVEAGTSGHIWGAWYVSRYPSYTKTGIERSDCERCDSYQTEIQDKLIGSGIEFKTQGAFAGDEMVVEVNLANNPGFAGLTFEIGYDNTVFELVKAEKGGLTTGGYLEGLDVPDEDGRLIISLTALKDNATNIEGDGTIAILTFKVAKNAAVGNYDITAKIIDTSDALWEDVALDEESLGMMPVVDFLWGDADADGDCDAADVSTILQYRVDKIALKDLDAEAADVNYNGAVTMADAQLIMLYLAGKYDPFE